MTSVQTKEWKIYIDFEIYLLKPIITKKRMYMYIEPQPINHIIEDSNLVDSAGRFTIEGIVNIFKYVEINVKSLIKNEPRYSNISHLINDYKFDIDSIICAKLELIDLTIKDKYLNDNPFYGPELNYQVDKSSIKPKLHNGGIRGWSWCPNICNPYHKCTDYCKKKYGPKPNIEKYNRWCRYGNKCNFKNTTCRFKHP